ncbi:hypothetical protein HAV15_010759 [Penicillium sp. str. |nr:hypothetical protein HAV15_010759 [Penicillium sp. str. \
MSAPLRIRSWRAIETLQNATQLSRSSRAPNPRIRQFSSPMTKRAISYTTKNQNNQPAAKPSPSPSPSSSTAKPNPSASTPIPTGVPASRVPGSTPSRATTENISKSGLSDKPLELERPTEDRIDWTRSFHGLSAEPFPKEAADILLAETEPDEVEIKPDGILYLPEIKYRRILNRAFGPGGLVSVARGEQDYFSPDGIPTATEGCRSNALVRCCKDLGIASELWDPRWIRKYKAKYTREVFVEHVVNKRKTKIWTRKDDPVGYPWKESGGK